MSLSLAMIVKDEEKWLPGCLESVRGLVDEIVVLDTGSKDRTKSIAEAFGARAWTSGWEEDFSKARNEAKACCHGDWILSLDADERVLPGSVPVIRSLMQHEGIGGWSFWFQNVLGNDGGAHTYTHRAIRLFRNLPEVWWEGLVHEQISPSFDRIGMPCAQSDVVILHYGYQAAVVEEKKKTERTISLLRQELGKDPNSDFHWFNLGNAYYVSEDWKQAVEAFEHATLTLNLEQDHAALTFVMLSCSYQRLGWLEPALKAVFRARQVGIEHPALSATEADCYLTQGLIFKAIDAFTEARSHGEEDHWLGDRSVWTYKSDMGLAICYHRLAQAQLYKVRNTAPQYPFPEEVARCLPLVESSLPTTFQES